MIVQGIATPMLALGISGLALLAGVWGLVGALRANRRVRRLLPLEGGANLEQAVSQALQQAEGWRQLEARWNTDFKLLQDQQGNAIDRIGLIRYNPFENTGAELSFSLALLTDRGDGVVLTSLWGRDEVRVYAKPVQDHTSTFPLSREEQQAMDLAASRRAREPRG